MGTILALDENTTDADAIDKMIRFYEYQITSKDIDKGTTITCQIEGCSKDTDPGYFITFVMLEGKFDNTGNLTDMNNLALGLTHVCPAASSMTFTDGSMNGFVAVWSDLELKGGTLICYEGETNGDLDDSPEGGACFSGETVVEVQGKGPVEMKNLQVSDKVFVGTESAGTPMYQSVYSFGHLDKETPYEYLQIHTSPSSAKPLEMTAAHLLYVEGQAHPVRADTIQKGDTLIQDTVDGSKTSVKVTKVDKVTRNGAYMPLTKDGSIVVNQILASSYVSIMNDAPEIVSQYLNVVSEDQLLHWWLAPYRMVCENAPSLCENDYNEEGIAYWLVLGRFVARIGNSMGPLSQMVGLVAFGLFMAFAMALEAVVAFFASPIGFGVGATLFGLAKGNFAWNGIKVNKKLD